MHAMSYDVCDLFTIYMKSGVETAVTYLFKGPPILIFKGCNKI